MWGQQLRRKLAHIRTEEFVVEACTSSLTNSDTSDEAADVDLGDAAGLRSSKEDGDTNDPDGAELASRPKTTNLIGDEEGD